MSEEESAESSSSEEESTEEETEESSEEEEEDDDEEDKKEEPKYPEGPETEPFRTPWRKKEEGWPKPINGLDTLPKNLEHSCKEYKEKVLYRWRRVTKMHETYTVGNNRKMLTREHGPVQSLTYGQVWEIVLAAAAGFSRYCPELKKRQSKIGIYLDTCKEWVFCEHAIALQSGIVVTVYANLGFDALQKCINESELETIVCDATALQRIDRTFKGTCPTIKRLVAVGSNDYKPKNFECKNFYDIIQDGFKNPIKFKKFNPPKGDDLALIMYTSGTTGDPKGVMISHNNITIGIGAVKLHMDIGATDSHFSYLPLAHIFEQTLHHIVLFHGGDIAFGHPRSMVGKPGGAKKIGDLALFKPTIFCGVPRVFDTMMKGIKSKVRTAGGVKEKLFNTALNGKLKKLRKGKNGPARGAKIAFKKVRKMTGGRVKWVISAGAALYPETQEFMQAVLGQKCKVFQVYGLTEVGCSTVQILHEGNRFRSGTVGVVMANCEVKLVDVPEMGYIANPQRKDPETNKYPPRRGEVCMRGPTVTRGYYKKEDKTKEVFRAEGWFHSGDVGQMNPDGTFSIIDRIKNLVKLSSGEYVALEQIDGIYGSSNFVFPNGICSVPGKDTLVACVCVEPAYCKNWAKNVAKLETDEIKDLIKSEELKKAVFADIQALHKYKELKSWERISNIILLADEWTPENDLLTSSFKLKRRSIAVRYEPQLTEAFKVNYFELLRKGKGKKKKVEEESPEDDDGKKKKKKKKRKGAKIPTFFNQVKPEFSVVKQD